MVKDVIADAFLQQILTRPAEYDVIATLNLNGDYISDALAAQVGGIGIAPGANINYMTGHAIFEATHGTAPKYASQDKVNPGSVILSGEMMLRYLGWNEAADLIITLAGADDRAEASHLRLRAADAGRDSAQDQRVRPGHGGEVCRVSPLTPFESIDVPAILFRWTATIRHKRRVKALQLQRHGFPHGARRGFLIELQGASHWAALA